MVAITLATFSRSNAFLRVFLSVPVFSLIYLSGVFALAWQRTPLAIVHPLITT